MKRERKGKKNIKRLLMGILVLAFLSNNTYADNIDFKDVTEQWAKEPVRWGVKEGIVEGYPDGTFKPKKQVNEAEFAKLMAGYAKVLDVSNLKVKEGEHWAKEVYDALEEYAIPLGGYKSDKVKNTGLSRGQLARIVAAKNGFNLNERQAIYYLYENDLSDGKISGRLDFESYDKDSAVKRAEAVAFLRRLETKGVTTFKGKPSTVGAREIGGIKGVAKDETVITDEDFKKLAEEKGIKQVEKNNSSYGFANKVADKYGLKVDDSGEAGTGFELKGGNTHIAYDQEAYGAFVLVVDNYTSNKQIMIDLLKSTGKFTDKGLKELVEIIEVKHYENCCVPQYYEYIDGLVEVVGGIESGHTITLTLGFND